MSVPPSPNAFRRHVWPLFQRHRGLLVGALILNGVHGAAIALQNVYPKWLFSRVLEAPNLTTAERWHELAWLVSGYLVVSFVVRMAAWHTGYRMFTWVRERVVFALRGQFFVTSTTSVCVFTAIIPRANCSVICSARHWAMSWDFSNTPRWLCRAPSPRW